MYTALDKKDNSNVKERKTNKAFFSYLILIFFSLAQETKHTKKTQYYVNAYIYIGQSVL